MSRSTVGFGGRFFFFCAFSTSSSTVTDLLPASGLSALSARLARRDPITPPFRFISFWYRAMSGIMVSCSRAFALSFAFLPTLVGAGDSSSSCGTFRFLGMGVEAGGARPRATIAFVVAWAAAAFFGAFFIGESTSGSVLPQNRASTEWSMRVWPTTSIRFVRLGKCVYVGSDTVMTFHFAYVCSSQRWLTM